MPTSMPNAVIQISLNPVLVHIGPLAVHWYGVMYVIALVVGLRVVAPYAATRGISQKDLYDGFWPVLIAALIGGRLYFVMQSDFGYYLHHPGEIFATWEGGM